MRKKSYGFMSLELSRLDDYVSRFQQVTGQ
jgi:hypothetical protein